ncbi:MAG: serine protease [Candidatus Azambacteria bacterium]|nr:serine protease [Candidatus Azambacteria bacterium]
MTISRKILMVGAAGVAGGLVSSLFVLPFLVRTNFLNTATVLSNLVVLSPTPIIEKTENNSAIITQLNYFSEAINKIQPSIVAIQSFYGSTLIRYGSGIILTQDGLIATLNSIVPINAGVIQVTNAGKIYKAKVIFRDYNKNIAIISIAAEDNFQVVQLKSELPGLGQKLLIFAKMVDFSEDKPLIEEALVSQVDKNSNQFKLSLAYEPNFYGAALADNDGTILGLLDFRNQKPFVIMSKTMNDTLNTYLTNTRKL